MKSLLPDQNNTILKTLMTAKWVGIDSLRMVNLITVLVMNGNAGMEVFTSNDDFQTVGNLYRALNRGGTPKMSTLLDKVMQRHSGHDIILTTFAGSFTLNDLVRETDKYAKMLAQHNIKRKRIGILVPQLQSFLPIVMAVNHLGGIVVPLSAGIEAEPDCHDPVHNEGDLYFRT